MPVNHCAMDLFGSTIFAGFPFAGATIVKSVGQGGFNIPEDVKTVQDLLNRVTPPAGLKVDGFIGPLTIGAIRRFQTAQLGFNDGRVDPHGPTLARLNLLAGSPIPPGPVPPVPPPPPPQPKLTPIQAALAATPLAIEWTNAALGALKLLRFFLGLDSGAATTSLFDVANIHFHLDRDVPNTARNMDKLILVFERIHQVLKNPTAFYREGPQTATSLFADAPVGGLGFGAPANIITFRTQYPDCGPNCRAAMLVHEGAHLCGGLNDIIHFAHEFPLFDGEPQDAGTNNYKNMPTAEAIRNAASYAAFAIHVATGTDSRFGLDNKTL